MSRGARWSRWPTTSLITVGVYALSGFQVTPATRHRPAHDPRLLALRHGRGLRQGAREHQEPRARRTQTYAEAANLAVNQTLVRSINTSIVALIPVGAILYVSAVQLGASSLKDLALALFVGMAAGVYSSIFIATPLLVQLKSERDRGRSRPSGARRRARSARGRPLRDGAGRSPRTCRPGDDDATRPTRCSRTTHRSPGRRRAADRAAEARRVAAAPRRRPGARCRQSRSGGSSAADAAVEVQARQEVAA